MKKLTRALKQNIAVLGLLVGVFGALSGFAAVNAMTSKSPAKIDCQGTCVSITKDGIQPTELAVKAGEFVQFNTADGKVHNLALGDGNGDHDTHNSEAHEHNADFTSGDFGKDEAWRVQFKQPGTYKFHDHYNPDFRILVVVYEPNGVKALSL
ncbi:MAG: hypothetical protein M3Q79_03570 [bacterium]|nr:hypothetical protein [bacterium]